MQCFSLSTPRNRKGIAKKWKYLDTSGLMQHHSTLFLPWQAHKVLCSFQVTIWSWDGNIWTLQGSCNITPLCFFHDKLKTITIYRMVYYYDRKFGYVTQGTVSKRTILERNRAVLMSEPRRCQSHAVRRRSGCRARPAWLGFQASTRSKPLTWSNDKISKTGYPGIYALDDLFPCEGFPVCFVFFPSHDLIVGRNACWLRCLELGMTGDRS